MYSHYCMCVRAYVCAMWIHCLLRQCCDCADLSSDQWGTAPFSVQWSVGLNADPGSAAMTHAVLWALCTVLGQWDRGGHDYEGETHTYRHTHTLLSLWITKTSRTLMYNDMAIASVTSLVALCEEMLWSLQSGLLLTTLLAVVKNQKIWIWPVW